MEINGHGTASAARPGEEIARAAIIQEVMAQKSAAEQRCLMLASRLALAEAERDRLRATVAELRVELAAQKVLSPGAAGGGQTDAAEPAPAPAEGAAP